MFCVQWLQQGRRHYMYTAHYVTAVIVHEALSKNHNVAELETWEGSTLKRKG